MKYRVTLNIATITMKTYVVEADNADEAEDIACLMEDDGTRPDEVRCISHDRVVDSVKQTNP
jgi:hypothetical protein